MNRDRWYRTQKSPCYARIGNKGIDILEAKRAEFDNEYSVQRDKLNTAIKLLMEHHQSNMSSIDIGQRYNVSEETNRFVAESKAFASQISTVIEDLKNRDIPMRDGSPMQVEEGSSPPKDEWQILQRRVAEMEETVDLLGTEFTVSLDVREMVDKIFDSKVAELLEARKQEAQRMAQESPPQIVIPPECLQKLDESANQWQQVEAKLPKAVEDIRSLIVGNAQLASTLDQLKKENVAYRETLSKVGPRC